MRKQIYLALVHYPVYNKRRDVVCTSVTNFDIHDISRTCSTYDIKGYRLVVPVDAQKANGKNFGVLAGRIRRKLQ